ncbi:hypothetical protein SAMD00019534_091670, partial [Acytostelium subglobosum LB1]|uniref:hypothetical protein n=1 Tax=Acytostelium subglobosum LB1 TaxID=1410327 RepID=UPI000644C841
MEGQLVDLGFEDPFVDEACENVELSEVPCLGSRKRSNDNEYTRGVVKPFHQQHQQHNEQPLRYPKISFQAGDYEQDEGIDELMMDDQSFNRQSCQPDIKQQKGNGKLNDSIDNEDDMINSIKDKFNSILDVAKSKFMFLSGFFGRQDTQKYECTYAIVYTNEERGRLDINDPIKYTHDDCSESDKFLKE